MNTKTSTALGAGIAVVAALAIIVAAMSSGIQPIFTSSTSTTGGSESSTQSAAQQGVGSLSVLLTDPPNVPVGVTAMYVDYANLQVHVSDAGNASGWTTIQSSGSIELMSTINVSQTISSVNITSGSYNFLRFNITSATVTYNGQNYTAFVPSAELNVPIAGGIRVNASTPSATIIDISPTVINIGSQSNAEFIIRPVAVAYPVPASGVTPQERQQGFRMDLNNLPWWKNIQERFTANLTITSASLTETSLTISAMNTGTGNTTLRLVTISPLASSVQGQDFRFRLPAGLMQSAVLAVLPNGSLTQIQTYLHMMQPNNGAVYGSLFNQTGYALAPGANATLAFNGTLSLGFMGIVTLKLPTGSVVSGQQYLVTVIGDQTLASFVVTVP